MRHAGSGHQFTASLGGEVGGCPRSRQRARGSGSPRGGLRTRARGGCSREACSSVAEAGARTRTAAGLPVAASAAVRLIRVLAVCVRRADIAALAHQLPSWTAAHALLSAPTCVWIHGRIGAVDDPSARAPSPGRGAGGSSAARGGARGAAGPRRGGASTRSRGRAPARSGGDASSARGEDHGAQDDDEEKRATSHDRTSALRIARYVPGRRSPNGASSPPARAPPAASAW